MSHKKGCFIQHGLCAALSSFHIGKTYKRVFFASEQCPQCLHIHEPYSQSVYATYKRNRSKIVSVFIDYSGKCYSTQNDGKGIHFVLKEHSEHEYQIKNAVHIVYVEFCSPLFKRQYSPDQKTHILASYTALFYWNATKYWGMHADKYMNVGYLNSMIMYFKISKTKEIKLTYLSYFK